jgi:hypothetical protein
MVLGVGSEWLQFHCFWDRGKEKITNLMNFNFLMLGCWQPANHCGIASDKSLQIY